MNWIYFLIGVLLMNAMPHFTLGVWGGRILSAFGFGNTANIIYGLLCFITSVSLFAYEYGITNILDQPIYARATTILVIYFVTGKPLQVFFTKKG